MAGTPCNANNAPATCLAPGFTSNYLGKLDQSTGVITRVPLPGAAVAPQGTIFLP